jgi:hypothetical protein
VRQIMAQVNPDYYKTAGVTAPQKENGLQIAQRAEQPAASATALSTPPERKTSLARAETLGDKYLAAASAGAANVLAVGNR